MPKYRKKPLVITAVQSEADGWIDTLEGKMEFKAGDYIVTGVFGEKYPCKKDVFEASYDLVEEDEDPFGAVDLSNIEPDKLR